MPKIRLLKKTHGDECLVEWDEKVETTYSDARDTFAREMKTGRLAFRVLAPGHHEVLREFDPSIEGDVLLIPAIQGG